MAQPVAMVLAVCSARVKGFFCHSGCVMLMTQPVVMVLAVHFICNNKKNIIINNEIINYYMYIEVHQYTYIIVLFNRLHGVGDVFIILDVSLNHKFYVIQ